MLFHLSHQIFVLDLSGPRAAIAAFTLSVFTDNSEVAYVSLLMKVLFGTPGLPGLFSAYLSTTIRFSRIGIENF